MMACMILVCFSCHKEEELEKTPPEGALTHAFSVSPTKKVYFAKGNLQYRASTNTWRFAENQWDTIGSANVNRSATYVGWIDLFYYGTSGCGSCLPWNYYYISYPDSYGNYISHKELPNADIYGTEFDWGKNPIINGENKAELWRTLTVEEWNYLLYGRDYLGYPFGLGTLILDNGIEIIGAFVFPDDYYPSNNVDYVYYSNDRIMTVDELNSSGSVFLPYVGNIIGVHGGSEIFMRYENDRACFYWTGSRALRYEYEACCLQFNDHYLWPTEHDYGQGIWNAGGVRLVCDYN